MLREVIKKGSTLSCFERGKCRDM